MILLTDDEALGGYGDIVEVFGPPGPTRPARAAASRELDVPPGATRARAG